MTDDAGKEIKAVEKCFLNSSVLLCYFHVLHSWYRKLCHKHGVSIDSHKKIVWKDLWWLIKMEGWNDAKAQEQIIKAIDRWQEMGIEAAKKFADYFERWWKPKYEMWMVCVKGMARDIMNTNNLIETFYHKLKYTYMRGHLGCQLDGKVYLLVEIVL